MANGVPVSEQLARLLNLNNMEKTMKIITIVLISVFLFAGCSYTTHYVQSGSRVYEHTRAESIKIYAGEPDKEYIVIGSVASDVPGNPKKAADELKEEAAELGADAIIHVELNYITTQQRTGMSGVAVKFK
jgi:uncharacterized protein YbjQ (UPF0145 family)